MAKGAMCPWCGKLQFHRGRSKKTDKAYSKCGNCDAVGWIGTAHGSGGGSGMKCQSCGRRTLHRIYKSKMRSIAHCSNKACLAVLVFKGAYPAR